MTALPKLLDELSDEADLCRNEGATDIANLLDEAATALRAAARDLTVADDVLRECSKALNSSKVWGGMSYNYSPIHPINYNKARDSVNEYWNQKQAALSAAKERGDEG